MIKPYSTEAEASVLGSMILSTKMAAELIEVLKAEDFYKPAHKIIFEAVTKILGKGQELDLVTLRAALIEMGQLPDVGGIDYLVEISEYVPSPANGHDYAKIVLERKKRRDILALVDRTKKAAEEEEDIDQVAEKLEEEVGNIEGAEDEFRFESVRELTREIMDIVDRAMEGEDVSPFVCSTGFEGLDDLIGGYREGGFYLIGGRTSMGKTSFAMCSALKAAQSGTPVLVITLEMPAVELARKCMAILGNYPAWMLDGKPKGRQGRMFSLDPDFYQRVSNSAEELHNLPIEFASTSVSFYMDDVKKALSRMKRKYRKTPLVILDYIQLMDSKARETRAEQLNIISKQTKALGRKTRAAFIVLGQVNQKVDKAEDKVPELGDFSDSSGMTKAADAVLVIHRKEYYEARKERRPEHDTSEATIVVRKGRGGEGSGEASIWFQKKNTRFFEAQP